MVEVGQAAPDFTLPDQEGIARTLSGLQALRSSFISTRRTIHPAVRRRPASSGTTFPVIGRGQDLGVSPDSSGSHARFVQKFGLPFTLLADADHQVCETYGVWKEKNMYGRKSMGVERTTVVIDAKGIVRTCFRR